MTIKIKKNEVHVWRASLDRSERERKLFETVLTLKELYRAKRFHLRKDQTQFTLTRGMLRILLGRYLGRNPNGIIIEEMAHGKPRILPTENFLDLRFNVSHSKDRALFAFGLQHELGVDLEAVDPQRDIQKVARRYFSPSELKDFFGIRPQQRINDFYRYWTLKEAFVKGVGEGLKFPFRQVEVVSDRKKNFFQVRTARKVNLSSWVLQTLPRPFKEFVAALAVQDRKCRVKPFFTFPASAFTLKWS